MVVTLCIYTAGCSIIDELQIWIGRSDWPTLIAKVEKNCLDVFKVQSIWHAAHCKTTATVDTMIDAQKKEWSESRDNDGERQQPYWSAIRKTLLVETALQNRDIIRENALLLFSYDLLYLDFVDACQKGYFGYVEKCISCFTMIYQSPNNTRYGTKLIHMVAYYKKM